MPTRHYQPVAEAPKTPPLAPPFKEGWQGDVRTKEQRPSARTTPRDEQSSGTILAVQPLAPPFAEGWQNNERTKEQRPAARSLPHDEQSSSTLLSRQPLVPPFAEGWYNDIRTKEQRPPARSLASDVPLLFKFVPTLAALPEGWQGDVRTREQRPTARSTLRDEQSSSTLLSTPPLAPAFREGWQAERFRLQSLGRTTPKDEQSSSTLLVGQPLSPPFAEGWQSERFRLQALARTTPHDEQSSGTILGLNPNSPGPRPRREHGRAPLLPPQFTVARPHRRRYHGAGQSATTNVVPRKPRTHHPGAQPPPRGHVRRGRVPNLGLSNGPRPRRRPAVVRLAAPQMGHRRRGRVPNLGLNPNSPGPPPRREHGRAPLLPPQFTVARPHRRRYHGAGQSATTFVVPRKPRTHHPGAQPPPRGHVRRGRVPNLGLSNGPRPRRRPAVVRLAAPQMGHRRRGRVPNLGLANGPLPRHQRHQVGRRPAQPGRRRRARLPGTGQSATSFVVQSASQGRRRTTPPPQMGHRRRGRVPNLGLANGPLPRHQRHQVGRRPAQPGRRRRARLPGTGQSATSFVVQSASQGRRRTTPPPQMGHRRRGRVPVTGEPSVLVGRRRSAHRGLVGHDWPRLPQRKRRTRAKAQDGAPVGVTHRKRPAARRPLPAAGMAKRGQTPGSGLAARAIVRRRPPAGRMLLVPSWVARGSAWRSRLGWLSSAGQVILGPYWIVAADVYWAGAVAGEVLEG